MNIDEKMLDKIKGVIFGQAIGDALGLGTEFMSKARVRHCYPDGLTRYEQIVEDDHRDKWKRGEWTDDTDQMLCIMDSINQHHAVDIMDISRRIHSWAMNGGRGLGRTVRHVLKHKQFLENPHYASKAVWEQTNYTGAANGAVMRTSVLGIWQFHDEAAIKRNAEAVCKITHFDPRCVASCLAVTLAISRMLIGENDIEKLLRDIEAEVSPLDQRVAASFAWAKEQSIGVMELDGEGIGYTLKATGAGFWSLVNADSFESGLHAVIHEGGDADTNGAVAGALLGARTGYSGIPEHLKTGLVAHDDLMAKVDSFVAVLGE